MVDMHGIIESDWETHIGSKCKIVVSIPNRNCVL